MTQLIWICGPCSTSVLEPSGSYNLSSPSSMGFYELKGEGPIGDLQYGLSISAKCLAVVLFVCSPYLLVAATLVIIRLGTNIWIPADKSGSQLSPFCLNLVIDSLLGGTVPSGSLPCLDWSSELGTKWKNRIRFLPHLSIWRKEIFRGVLESHKDVFVCPMSLDDMLLPLSINL